jgi:hypothetical protein
MAEKMFEESGELAAFWLVERADGEQAIIATPMIVPKGMPSGEFKERVAHGMREMFRQNNVVRYAKASEVWSLEQGLDTPMPDRISDHPLRKEMVWIEAADSLEHIYALRDIIRPEHGKPYLAKLGEIERPTKMGGRWLDLLPRAS